MARSNRSPSTAKPSRAARRVLIDETMNQTHYTFPSYFYDRGYSAEKAPVHVTKTSTRNSMSFAYM